MMKMAKSVYKPISIGLVGNYKVASFDELLHGIVYKPISIGLVGNCSGFRLI